MTRGPVPVLLWTLLVLALVACVGASVTTVEVPAGAQAGDLVLEPCELGQGEAAIEAECGLLVVPENRSRPDSRLIALPLAVVRARSGPDGEAIFGLGGGPGSSNVAGAPPEWMFAGHDVVNIGYRGADGSVVLDMPEVRRALRGGGGDLLSADSIENLADAMTRDFERMRGEGIDLAGYTVAEVVADLEAAREALGYERIDLFSASYGTRLAQLYGYLHPERVHRSFMVAVNPPGRMVWEPEVLDEQLEHISGLCARDPDCSARTPDLAATIRSVVADMPRRWLFLPIDPGKVRLAAFVMMSITPPNIAASVYDTFIAAENGDASGLAAITLAFTLPPFSLDRASNWGDLFTKGLTDFDPERDYLSEMDPPDSILGSPHSLLFFGAAQLARPELGTIPEELKQPQMSEVETLLVSGSIDLSTPARYATEELLPFLANGDQVILSEFGHLDFYQPPEAFAQLVLGFFERGEADVSGYGTRSFEFTPGLNFVQLGKLIAAGIVVIAAIFVATTWLLLWQVRRRLRRRGASR